jgi:hypothetical protein
MTNKKMTLSEALAVMFVQFGKKQETEQLGIYFEILKGEPRDSVLARINTLRRTSKYLPAVSEILDFPENRIEKDCFIERFRRQCRYESEYAMILDDDVFTIRKILGHRRVMTCSLQEMIWIEKDASKEYERLKLGEIELIEDPNRHRVKTLPGGAKYILQRPKMSLSPNALDKLDDMIYFSLPSEKQEQSECEINHVN